MPVTNTLKLVITQIFFFGHEGHVSLPTQHVHSVTVSFVMGAAVWV